MIVSVCSDKGAPGATTLATVLSLVWSGPSVVLEADPSGSDLTFRLRNTATAAQTFLPAEPSVFTLAGDARTGLIGSQGLARYAQDTTLGVRVIPGPLQAEQTANLRPVWPMLASLLAQSPETVIADLGRLQPGHTAGALAQASTAVLVLARPDVEGMYHLRERVAQLAADLGDEQRTRNPVAVVMLAGAKEHRRVLDQTAHMLSAGGSPIPVAGWMALDPAAVAALRTGEMTKALARSPLLSSARELVAYLTRWWPHLNPATPSSGPEVTSVPAGRGANRFRAVS